MAWRAPAAAACRSRAGRCGRCCAPLPFAIAALFAGLLGALGIVSAAPVARRFRRGRCRSTARRRRRCSPCCSCSRWRGCCGRWRCGGWASARDRTSDAAGVGMLLVMLALGVVVWLTDPIAALLLIPGDARLAPDRLARAPAAPARGARAGARPDWCRSCCCSRFYADQLGLGPGRVAWMGVLLLAGGHVDVPAALLWSIGLGCAAATVMLSLSGRTIRLPTAARRTTRRSRSADPCPTPAPARSAARSRLCDDRPA